jgi:hypothetical protein
MFPISFPQDSTTAFLQTGNCKSLNTTSPPGVIPKYVYFGQGKDGKEDCTIPELCTCYYSSQLEEVMSGICRYLLTNLVSILVKLFKRYIHSTLPQNLSVFRPRAQLYASISLLEYGREIMPTHRCKKPPTIEGYT